QLLAVDIYAVIPYKIIAHQLFDAFWVVPFIIESGIMGRLQGILVTVASLAWLLDARALGETVGEPWSGEPGIVESVAQIMARQASSPRVEHAPRHRHARNTQPRE